MITNELKEGNKKKFLAAIKGYNVCDQALISALEDMGLFTCPASTSLNLHNAFEGGLIDHALRVTNYALKIAETLPEDLRPAKESLVKVSLLHGIGKVGLYVKNKSEWHVKNLGKVYEFDKDIISMVIAERSIFYINTYGKTHLSDVEFQAIMNYGKTDSDMAEWHTEPLGEVLKSAIKFAIIEEKHIAKKQAA